jgi:hypothetical protein
MIIVNTNDDNILFLSLSLSLFIYICDIFLFLNFFVVDQKPKTVSLDLFGERERERGEMEEKKRVIWIEMLKFVSVDECVSEMCLVSRFVRSCVVDRLISGEEEAFVPLTRSTYLRFSAIKKALDPESDVNKAWRCHRIYEDLDNDVNMFMKRYASHVHTSSSSFKKCSRNIPHIFNAIESIRKWPAYRKWTGRDNTTTTTTTTNKRMFRCGETEDGEELLVSMSDMFEYCLSCRDDTPIYIFDRDFAKRYESMLMEYDSKVIPEKYLGIKNNLLDLHDTKRCPPRRWLLVGPRGSGTDVHTDPRGTCAWNALLRGRKLWALLDPTFSKHQVGEGENADDMPSSRWFLGNHLSELIKTYPNRVYLFLQRQGDVVYVPPNYYHAVWNLDHVNVAVTENIITTSSFQKDCYENEDAKGDEKLCKFVENYYGLLDETHSREWLNRVVPIITSSSAKSFVEYESLN